MTCFHGDAVLCNIWITGSRELYHEFKPSKLSNKLADPYVFNLEFTFFTLIIIAQPFSCCTIICCSFNHLGPVSDLIESTVLSRKTCRKRHCFPHNIILYKLRYRLLKERENTGIKAFFHSPWHWKEMYCIVQRLITLFWTQKFYTKKEGLWKGLERSVRFCVLYLVFFFLIQEKSDL